MDVKGVLYRGGMAAWVVLVIGAWLSVGEGYTEPWLTISDFPGGSEGTLAAAIGVAIAGLSVIGFLRRRHVVARWREAGRRAGLRPAGDGSFKDAPELTGSVGGRTVTVRYEKRREGSSGEGSGNLVTYTSVEAELSSPADGGVIVLPASRRGDSHTGSGAFETGDITETIPAAEGVVAVAAEGLILIGTPQAAVEAVADGLSGRALRAIRDLEVVAVGNASGVAAEWTGEGSESSILGLGVGDAFLRHVPSDETTVTVETRAFIRNGDGLRRFAEGAVAVADAFEEATARPSAPK